MAWEYIAPTNVGSESESRGYWYNPETTEISQNDPNLIPSAENLWGWNPNMAVPKDGFLLGQLLAPNYLSQGDSLSDPAALARAAREVAPGYTGPLNMDAVVPNWAVRAPAKDEGLAPFALMMPAIGGIMAAAMAGAGGLSTTAGMTEAGWGFGAGGLGGDAAGLASAVGSGTAGGGMNWWDTDWGTEGLLDTGGSGINMNDLYSSLDDMQSFTNGVTAPSPTVSVPGYGDVYGSWDSILKNMPKIPGLSNILSGVMSKAAGGDRGSLDMLRNIIGGGTGGTDWGKILGGLIGYKMTDDLADKYFTRAGEIADKYKRPWDEWLPIARQMRDDPQGYMNQYWKPMIGQFTDEAARKAAAGGFNNSGSGVNQIADTVTNRSIQSIFNPNYDANLKAAGLYQSPSTAAGIEGDLTSKGLGVVNQANSNLGFAAREATSGLLGGSRQSTDDIYNNIMKTFFS